MKTRHSNAPEQTASRSRFEDRLFVINKHSGPSSFAVVKALRGAAKLRKVGHTGTLDPLASGVLLLCTGRATRAAEHFVELPKSYDFDVVLGVETATLDAEGDIVREVPCPDLSREELDRAAAAFVGDYDLEPPLYSAIKRGGRRLYELARSGEDVPTVEPRRVHVYAFDVLGVDLPLVRVRVECSRGTYVRSLARDLGKRFGVPAHIRRLVRTAVGPFSLEHAFPSERIFDGEVDDLEGIALADALGFLPGIVINGRSRRSLFYGSVPARSDVVSTIGTVKDSPHLRILDEDGELLAVGHRDAQATWIGSYRLLVDRRTLGF